MGRSVGEDEWTRELCCADSSFWGPSDLAAGSGKRRFKYQRSVCGELDRLVTIAENKAEEYTDMCSYNKRVL